MSEFAQIAILAIFSSNIIAVTGIGAISLQSEKRNFIFMLVSSLCTMLPIIFSGLMYFVVENYILVPLDAEYLKLFILSLLIVVFSYLIRMTLKRVSKEEFFLYEKSYGFPLQIAVGIGTLCLVNFAQTFFIIMFELAMFSVGYLLIQIIFYALYERLDNKYTLKAARNVPLMLYALSLVSMILYAIGMFM